MDNDIFVARTIGTDWAILLDGMLLDGELPEELATALEVFTAAEAARPPAVADTITAKNAAQVIAAAVDAEVRLDKWAEVHGRILGGLARTVTAAAVNATGELIAAQEERFRADVDTFLLAASALQEDITEAGLVRAGSDALRAYETALTAQGALKRYESWLASVPWTQTVRNDIHVLRLIRPTTRSDYAALCNASARRDQSKISSVYLYAAQHGLHWEMTAPWEAKEIAEALNAAAVPARAL